VHSSCQNVIGHVGACPSPSILPIPTGRSGPPPNTWFFPWVNLIQHPKQHLGSAHWCNQCWTRRPASADRTARRQFQATGQPVSWTEASDAMTSWLSRYEVKCVQRRCFQCGSVPFRSDIKGTELPPANILIPLERQLIALQLCHWQFLYNETVQQTFRPLLSKLSKRRQI